MNKYDIFRWVKRVIDSSISLDQRFSNYNLISNFGKMFNDIDLTIELLNYSFEKTI